MLNASGSALTAATSGFFAEPVATDNNAQSALLIYDPVTSEIRQSAVKTFVINHPVDKSKYLVHACLEGPESGVYYRGEGEILDGEQCITINLPEYVDSLATDFTVHITQIYDGRMRGNLSYSRVENNQFCVYGDPGPFSWVVYGKRGTIEVEPKKAHVYLKGSGPYTWVETANNMGDQ